MSSVNYLKRRKILQFDNIDLVVMNRGKLDQKKKENQGKQETFLVTNFSEPRFKRILYICLAFFLNAIYFSEYII